MTLKPKTLIHLKGHFLAGKEQITANTLLHKALDMVQFQFGQYLLQIPIEDEKNWQNRFTKQPSETS